MNNKKILVFSNYYLPGYKAGGPIRSVSNVIEIFKNTFDFCLVTFDRDINEKRPYHGVISNHWSYKAGLKIFYASNGYLSLYRLYKLIVAEAPDLIYLNSFWSVSYSLKIVLLHRLGLVNTKILLAPRGEFSEGGLKYKKLKKKIALFVFNLINLHKNIYFQATNSEESQLIFNLLRNSDRYVFVASNIPSYDNNCMLYSDQVSNNDVVKLVYISRITPIKNLKFALNLLKKVEFSLVFDIYGPIESVEYWNECKKIIQEMPDDISVTYKGAVLTSDIFGTLKTYHALLLPTLGENFGHIIVEAMLAGTKVIISDKTPWRSLVDHGLGWDLPLQHESFMNALNNLYKMYKSETCIHRNLRVERAKNLVGVERTINQNKKMFDSLV